LTIECKLNKDRSSNASEGTNQCSSEKCWCLDQSSRVESRELVNLQMFEGIAYRIC
jgi:hypothetical protein